MTVTVGRIKRTLNRKLRGYEPKTFIEPGVTGDYDGNVDAGANRSYVRVRGMVTIAHNQVAGETSNTPVWVGYTKENDRLYQVTGVTARGGVDMPWSMTMGKHRERHEWPTGDDIPWLSIEQIRNLRVYPVAGTVTVRVNPGMSEGVDEWAQVFRLAALDLSGDIPGAGALWALIYIDNNNAVTYTLGDAVDSLDLLTSAYIPQTPSGGYALAAVRLYDGQTEIIESAYPPNNDIVDLRFAGRAGIDSAVNDAMLEIEHHLEANLAQTQVQLATRITETAADFEHHLDAEIARIETLTNLDYVWLSISGVQAAGVKPATLTLNGNGWIVASFADGQEQQVQANLKIPSDADYSQPVNVCLGWSSPTTSQDCDWEVYYLISRLDESTDQAGTPLQDYKTSSAVADGLVVSPFDNITIESGDICIHLVIQRDGNDGSDTLSAVAELHGVALRYTKRHLF